MTKVSISVPVYNVEKYLPQCLDSLLNQTLKEIEIILVDDGSSDSSGAICDECAQKDSCIKVIHKENAGIALARQATFDVAKGEYMCACDADVLVEPNMYEQFYGKAVNYDADYIVCDNYRNYQNDYQELYSIKNKDFNQDRAIENTLRRNFTHKMG